MQLPGFSLFRDVHSTPLPKPGYGEPGTNLSNRPKTSGQFSSKLKKIQRPRLDRPQLAYTAQTLAKRYGFPTIATQTQWVGFVSLGGGISADDVNTYCHEYGLPVPPIRIVSVDGATNAYTGDPNGADGENALDCQNIIGATGGKLGVLMYVAPNSGSGFANAVKQATIDDLACALAISWGSTEANNSPQDRAEMDTALEACCKKLIWPLPASGDDGSSDGTSGVADDYPSSSPWSIACGGTSLAGAVESAWNFGGGGPSHVYGKPTFQTTAPGNARGVPDVALNADPNSGYPVYINGKWMNFGGTSAVGPMWAALIGLIVSIRGSRIPDLIGEIYRSNLLTDITVGSNGAWKAGIGYDYCTGEGVPNKVFVDYLIGNQVPPCPPPPSPPVPPPPPVLLPPTPPPVPIGTIIAAIDAAFAAMEQRFPFVANWLRAANQWIDAWLKTHPSA